MYKKRKTFILINAVVSVCWWLLGPLGGCHGCYTSNALTIISAISNENSFFNICQNIVEVLNLQEFCRNFENSYDLFIQ